MVLARRRGRMIAVLACLGIAAGCGAGPAGSPLASGTPATSQPPRAVTATTGAARAAGLKAGAGIKATVKRADLLNGVSCTGRECVAVGGYYDGTAAEHTLAERWTGSAWRVQSSPDGPRYSSLQAVSCPAGTSCTAVGSPVMAWDGARWSITRPASLLTAVSCAGARSCMAVGQTAPGRAGYASWNGRAWRAGPVPGPPQRGLTVTVAGVSCTSAVHCVAVGDYSSGTTAQPAPGSYRDEILAEAWDGRSWRLLPAAGPGRADQLSAVSCTSPANCTAVGSSAGQFPLAEHWNGRTWQVQPVPAPGRIGYTQLTAISCGSPARCMAVGTYQGLPIAESWEGGAWRWQWLPGPPAAGHSARLSGVSCAGPAACMAVGVSGNGLSYAERYHGRHWSLVRTPNPGFRSLRT